MANPDTPFGLRPCKHLSGNPYNGQTMRCWTSTTAGAIYIGDIVDIQGSSCIKGCCPHVAIYTNLNDATEQFGVMTSVENLRPAQAGYHPEDHGDAIYDDTNYRLTAIEMFINVVCDPNVIYLVQGDTATTSATGDAWDNSIFVDGGGSAVTGLSGIELDVSEIASDKSLTAFVLGTVDAPDRAIGINDLYYVLLNTSIFTGTLGRALGI